MQSTCTHDRRSHIRSVYSHECTRWQHSLLFNYVSLSWTNNSVSIPNTERVLQKHRRKERTRESVCKESRKIIFNVRPDHTHRNSNKNQKTHVFERGQNIRMCLISPHGISHAATTHERTIRRNGSATHYSHEYGCVYVAFQFVRQFLLLLLFCFENDISTILFNFQNGIERPLASLRKFSRNGKKLKNNGFLLLKLSTDPTENHRFALMPHRVSAVQVQLSVTAYCALCALTTSSAN